VSDNELKVTDKRMFTADGELREEVRHLDDETPAVAESPGETALPSEPEDGPREEPDSPPPSTSEAGGAPRPAAAPEVPPAATEHDPPAEDSPRIEIPSTPGGLGTPTFLDLVTLLAEPIALYLGDAELPNGESAENLEMARLHIDLLDVLRRTTAGNLEVGEARVLEDLLYRCRLRYVQKRG
jgi:hypothetical protein